VDANSKTNRGARFVTRTEADDLVQRGLAYYIPNALGEPNRFVPNGDWHTPSWLTLPEILQALDHAHVRLVDCSAEFRAAIVAMKELSNTFGRDSVRLVFWFLQLNSTTESDLTPPSSHEAECVRFR